MRIRSVIPMCSFLRSESEDQCNASPLTGRTDVGEGLLDDAQELAFYCSIERPVGSTDVEVKNEMIGAELFSEARKPRGQRVLRGCRTEVPYAAAGLGDALANVSASAVELVACR